MTKKKTKRSYGIWVRCYAPMLLLIFTLCMIIYSYIASGGIPKQLNKNSDKTMQSVVQTRAEQLSNSMTHRWTEMGAFEQSLLTLYDNTITNNGYTIKDVISNENLYVDFLNSALSSSIEVLRRNLVSGVYIVLADQESVQNGNTTSLPGIFLRDRDPDTAYNNTNKDLLFERAPVAVVQQSGISTDSFWTPNFSISEDGDLSDVFFKPYLAALDKTNKESTDFAYWSTSAQILHAGSESIFYSIPLISKSGEVFGIIGVDIIKSYFAEFLPYSEILGGDGAYAIFKKQENNVTLLESFSKTGKYTNEFWDELNINPTSNFETTSFESDQKYTIQTAKLKLYNSNSTFVNESWYVCAIAPNELLYKTTTDTVNSVFMLVVWLGSVTVFGVGTIIYQIAKPIKNLERKLKSHKLDSEELNLGQTGISELDLLASAVEKLNIDVRASAGKFSQILEMSSINLGAFEFDKKTSHWFISNDFFKIFGEKIDVNKLDINTTLDKLQEYKSQAISNTLICNDGGYECIYEAPQLNDNSNFVRIKIESCDLFIRGFVEDVSIEWREIRKLDYDRNHDTLTDIYNRRGFYEHFYNLMDTSPEVIKNAAVVMLDLDNLKILNDTYGHDIGDKYIMATAKALKEHSNDNIIVSRISGDEFLVFAYGYDDIEDCNKFLTELERNISSKKIAIGKDNIYSIYISAGIAYYPTDSTDRIQLIKYADFAMYQGKRTLKGQFNKFDLKKYEKEELRIKRKDALNEIIRNNSIVMHFQPIIDAQTAEIFAYEALMRPQNDTLKSPLDLLKVARKENKLCEIEVMVNLATFKAFANWCEKGVISNPNCKVFINTIVNEIMPKEAFDYLESNYEKYLSRTVSEYTEDEKANEEILLYKRQITKKWQAEVALDDYGSGYNGEVMLLNTDIHYIKLDIVMIKNIHNDINRQQRVTDIVKYAHSRGIKIIAEGIESKDECIMLRKLGVDYLQGYYFAKPALVPPLVDKKKIVNE